MSRTLKDRPWKTRFRDWHEGYQEGTYGLKAPGFWPKVKREVDENWHWCSGTPSWWCNLFMNRPIRRKAQQWERKVETSKIEDIESLDTPNNSKKPHKYYF